MFLFFPRAPHPILVSTSVRSSFCSKRHVTAEWTGTTPSTYLWSRSIMKWSVICWVMIRPLNLKWNKEKMVFLYLDSPKFKWTTLMNWMRYASFTEWLIDWPFDWLIDRCLSVWLLTELLIVWFIWMLLDRFLPLGRSTGLLQSQIWTSIPLVHMLSSVWRWPVSTKLQDIRQSVGKAVYRRSTFSRPGFKYQFFVLSAITDFVNVYLRQLSFQLNSIP